MYQTNIDDYENYLNKDKNNICCMMSLIQF